MIRDRNLIKTVQRHRRWIQRIVIVLLFFLIGLPYYGFHVEPYWLQVKTVPVTLAHLAPEFDGFRIAQLSDLHVDAQMPEKYLAKVIKTVNAQQPDLIAITGDFVTDTPQAFAPILIQYLSLLQSPTVAVLGNHDHWSDPEVILDILKRSQIEALNNRVTTLKRGTAQLQIAGVDDVWAGAANLEQVLQQLSKDSAAILLAHEPDFADTSAATHRFDLQLSGHSHGGQVTLPGIKPPVLPPYGKRYPVGQYQVQDMIQYTNRGIGMVKPRARFSSRPELTIFKLSSIQRSK